MMRKLLKDILVIDIETVSGSPDYDQLSGEMKKHWDRKSDFLLKREEVEKEDLYFERAGIYAEFGQVIVIAVGIFHELDNGTAGLRVMSFASKSEKELLEKFSAFLNTKFNQKTVRLCAHNGKEFDYPYLCRRMLINGLIIPAALDQSGKKPWEVNHLDTMEMWKFGDRKSFTSLALLSTLFGIPSSKSDIDGSQVNEVYYKEDGLNRIAEYCRGDVIATAQLYLKLTGDTIILPSNITVVNH